MKTLILTLIFITNATAKAAQTRVDVVRGDLNAAISEAALEQATAAELLKLLTIQTETITQNEMEH